MSNRVNPYDALKKRFNEYVNAVEYRMRKKMFIYPKHKLTEGYLLDTLYERVAAAEQLGFDVLLKATDEGLVAQYIKKLPDRPYDI